MKIDTVHDLTPGRDKRELYVSRYVHPAVWTAEDNKFLCDNAGKLRDWQIAERLGRSPSAVRNRAGILHISLRIKK